MNNNNINNTNNNKSILQFNKSNVYFLYGVGRINIFENDEANRQYQQFNGYHNHHQNNNYSSTSYYDQQQNSMFINNQLDNNKNNIITPIKSTIIAKKTKFWKYLEEEKWKKTSLIEKKYDRKILLTESTTSDNNNNSNNNLFDINFMDGCTLGITGSDHCRCMDCQSRYFECDEDSYDSEYYDIFNSVSTDYLANEHKFKL